MGDVLVGLRQTGAVGAVEPAVIVAAQPALLDVSVAEVGAAVPAMPVQQPKASAPILVEGKVFAEQPHRLWPRLGESLAPAIGHQ
jgi:hypothetical protein